MNILNIASTKPRKEGLPFMILYENYSLEEDELSIINISAHQHDTEFFEGSFNSKSDFESAVKIMEKYLKLIEQNY